MTVRLAAAAHASGIGEAGGDDVTTTNDELAKLLSAARQAFEGGGGGGGKPPSKHSSLITIAIGLIAAIASAAGGYAVLKATVADNTTRIERHEAKPMHDDDAKYMSEVDKHVGVIEDRLANVEKGQAAIARGIDELKQENINRLKADLEKAEAELRRRRRND